MNTIQYLNKREEHIVHEMRSLGSYIRRQCEQTKQNYLNKKISYNTYMATITQLQQEDNIKSRTLMSEFSNIRFERSQLLRNAAKQQGATPSCTHKYAFK